MPPEPVRLADFTVRLFLPGPLLADEDRVNAIVAALNNLGRRRLVALARFELENRPVFARPPFHPLFHPDIGGHRRGSWRLGRLASRWLANAARRRGQSPSGCDCFGLGVRAA